MHTKSLFTATLATILLTSTTTTTASPLTPRQTTPKINVTFFSTPDCSIGFPSTTHHTTIFGSAKGVANFPCDSYSSLIINKIDDQFIGTNTALQVGNTASAKRDFTNAVKFSVATRATVGRCQFVGIPQKAPGKPLLSGNEYRLTSLQG